MKELSHTPEQTLPSTSVPLALQVQDRVGVLVPASQQHCGVVQATHTPCGCKQEVGAESDFLYMESARRPETGPHAQFTACLSADILFLRG